MAAPRSRSAPDDGDAIAALGDAHIQPLFQPGEIFLVRAAQRRQQLVVGEFQRAFAR